MIDHFPVLEFMERAGFGGATRPKLYPRMLKFAELIAKWENEHCSKICTDLGNHYSIAHTDFMDGKMDGAYTCADSIERRWNETR